MIRRLPLALSAALLLGAHPALAADALSSSFWEAQYLNAKVDTGVGDDLTPEGYRVGLGIGLAKFLRFSGDYDQRKYFGAREGFGSAMIAYHTQDPRYQFHFGASYERIQTVTFLEEGYGVEVGGRAVWEVLEGHAEYRYLDFGSLHGTSGKGDFTGGRYGLGLGLQLCPWWTLTADYQVREHKVDDGAGNSGTIDYNQFFVGLRRYFVTEHDRRARKGGVLNDLFSGDEETPAQ